MEPELRELLCVLLDADLNFDLSSVKFPHLIGGGVAAMLQEVSSTTMPAVSIRDSPWASLS